MLGHQPPPLYAAPTSPDGPGSFNLTHPLQPGRSLPLNAVGHARMAQSQNRQQQYANGTISAPYPGAFSLSTASHDTSPSASNMDPAARANPNGYGRRPAAAPPRHSFFSLPTSTPSQQRPLPPEISGMPWPNGYDPSQSMWKVLEPGSTQGCIRLAGRDVDLYRLWSTVAQMGGIQKINQQNAWNMLLSHLDLPEHFIHPQNGTQQMTAPVLSQYYNAILGLFDQFMRRNQQERQTILARQQQQQQHQQQQQQQQQMAMSNRMPPQPGMAAGSPTAQQFPPPMQNGAGNMMGMMGAPNPGAGMNGNMRYPSAPGPMAPPTPQLMQRHPSQSLVAVNGTTMPGDLTVGLGAPGVSPDGFSNSMSDALNAPLTNGHIPPDLTLGLSLPDGDTDSEGRKRKASELEEQDEKRARQKTDSEGSPESERKPSVDGTNGTPASPVKLKKQPSRRKIEYLPLARELDTAGGRDVAAIKAERVAIAGQRRLRDISEWGTVDIEALTMSLRSRISTELSYSLTTFTLLSALRPQTPQAPPPLPLSHCGDLLEEVIDLLEDTAFNGVEDDWTDKSLDDDVEIPTNRQLTTTIVEDSSSTFAGLEYPQGAKDPKHGPRQRPGDTILIIMNLLRNLAINAENHVLVAQHPRILDVILRLSMVVRNENGALRALSPVLSLSDVISIRKDVLYILANIAGFMRFSATSSPSSYDLRIAYRSYELLASFLVDPNDALTPLQLLIQMGGLPPNPELRPPSLLDMTLEAFSRLTQPDANREVFSKAVPHARVWALFAALVRRLPIADADFSVAWREPWLLHCEKAMMGIYSLAYMAPPALKRRMKTSRDVRFPSVVLRMLRKSIKLAEHPQLRMIFSVLIRRAVEALRLMDGELDSFDISEAVGPAISFGLGYGEHGENRVERGTGVLGGYQEEVTWQIMFQRDMDDILFSELESLCRVE